MDQRLVIYPVLMLIGMPLCAYGVTRIWQHNETRTYSLLTWLGLFVCIIMVGYMCHFTTLSPDVNWLLACLAYFWLNVVFWRCTFSSEISVRVLGYVLISLTAFAGLFGLFPAVIAGVNNRYDSDKQLAERIYFRTGQRGFVSASTTELQVQVTQRFAYLPGIEKILLDTALTAPPGSEVETHTRLTAKGNALIYRLDKGKEYIIFKCVSSLKPRVMALSQ